MPLQSDRITANLGLPELEVLGIAEGGNELIVHVKRRQDMECCPGCGCITDKIHSAWRALVFDLPLFGKKLKLEVLKRRFRCGNGCKPFTEGFGCLERYKRQTKRYRAHLEGHCRHTSVASAARKTGIGYKQMEGLYYEKARARAADFEKQPLGKVMGFDEFSGKRGVRMHVGMTDLSDENKPRLWDVQEKKDCERFLEFFDKYSREERSQVEIVVHDMDQGFNSWTKIMFPRAIHVIDKFHLVRTMLKHLERVRKAAYRKSQSYWNKKFIRSCYWLIKKRFKDLNMDQKVKLEKLFEMAKPLKDAYLLKESFMTFYDTPKRRSEAELEFDILHGFIKETPHFKRFCWALKNWREEILNYFAVPYTNAFTEGMNNKIKTLKRQAYGFRNFERFRVRILNECALA